MSTLLCFSPHLKQKRLLKLFVTALKSSRESLIPLDKGFLSNNVQKLLNLYLIKMRYISTVVALLAVTFTATACQPATYECGSSGGVAVVNVCNGQGALTVAARCNPGQTCTIQGGVGYCV